MSYTLENIREWTYELSKNSSFVQYRAYCIIEIHNDRRKQEEEILRVCGLSDRIGGKQVTIIKEDLAVVCYTDTKNNIYYIPYSSGKPSFEWFRNFESALLAAVCLQQTGLTDAVKYAAKILEVPV